MKTLFNIILSCWNMDKRERLLVLHYAERIVIERQEAA